MRVWAAVFLVLATIGCVNRTSPTGATRDVVDRPRYASPPDRYVQSQLLSFESALDLAFIESRDVAITADPERPGNQVLRTKGATIKLGALLRGRTFPGSWDLIGLRVRSDAADSGTIRVVGLGHAATESGTTFEVAAGGWQTLWFDIARLVPATTSRPASGPSKDGSLLQITTGGTTVMVDDLVLAQGGTVIAESKVPETGKRFLVRRVAKEWQALFGDEVVLRLPALPFVADGYRVADAGPTRVLFTKVDGTRSVCIDRTGRLLENGKTRPDAPRMNRPGAVDENASPAMIDVIGGGRVERSLPGDRDNDGYDETRGSYAVRASGNRVRFRLASRRAVIRWPVVEIYDLPPGAASVWLQGQIVRWVTRADDGRVIVELPIESERPVDVQVRVR